ncbi:hypothetical protein ACGFIV_00785 [Sphaerisporangium sp. NPDC049003]|uniref:hypothetical protein n=1 Tax=Sphaerisporangium sp. NPDC049003 TaxID=3364517 RepID=UPI003721D8A1
MTQQSRYVLSADEQLTKLAERWPPGSLIINLAGRQRGVVTVVADSIASDWNDGNPGHLALMAMRQEAGLGGLVHAAWEHGDSCWTRVGSLGIEDRDGLYRVIQDQEFPWWIPVYRLAEVDGELIWWPADRELLSEWSWADRRAQAVIDAQREARELRVCRLPVARSQTRRPARKSRAGWS